MSAKRRASSGSTATNVGSSNKRRRRATYGIGLRPITDFFQVTKASPPKKVRQVTADSPSSTSTTSGDSKTIVVAPNLSTENNIVPKKHFQVTKASPKKVRQVTADSPSSTSTTSEDSKTIVVAPNLSNENNIAPKKHFQVTKASPPKKVRHVTADSPSSTSTTSGDSKTIVVAPNLSNENNIAPKKQEPIKMGEYSKVFSVEENKGRKASNSKSRQLDQRIASMENNGIEKTPSLVAVSSSLGSSRKPLGVIHVPREAASVVKREGKHQCPVASSQRESEHLKKVCGSPPSVFQSENASSLSVPATLVGPPRPVITIDLTDKSDDEDHVTTPSGRTDKRSLSTIEDTTQKNNQDDEVEILVRSSNRTKLRTSTDGVRLPSPSQEVAKGDKSPGMIETDASEESQTGPDGSRELIPRVNGRCRMRFKLSDYFGPRKDVTCWFPGIISQVKWRKHPRDANKQQADVKVRFSDGTPEEHIKFPDDNGIDFELLRRETSIVTSNSSLLPTVAVRYKTMADEAFLDEDPANVQVGDYVQALYQMGRTTGGQAWYCGRVARRRGNGSGVVVIDICYDDGDLEMNVPLVSEFVHIFQKGWKHPEWLMGMKVPIPHKRTKLPVGTVSEVQSMGTVRVEYKPGVYSRVSYSNVVKSIFERALRDVKSPKTWPKQMAVVKQSDVISDSPLARALEEECNAAMDPAMGVDKKPSGQPNPPKRTTRCGIMSLQEKTSPNGVVDDAPMGRQTRSGKGLKSKTMGQTITQGENESKGAAKSLDFEDFKSEPIVQPRKKMDVENDETHEQRATKENCLSSFDKENVTVDIAKNLKVAQLKDSATRSQAKHNSRPPLALRRSTRHCTKSQQAPLSDSVRRRKDERATHNKSLLQNATSRSAVLSTRSENSPLEDHVARKSKQEETNRRITRSKELPLESQDHHTDHDIRAKIAPVEGSTSKETTETASVLETPQIRGKQGSDAVLRASAWHKKPARKGRRPQQADSDFSSIGEQARLESVAEPTFTPMLKRADPLVGDKVELRETCSNLLTTVEQCFNSADTHLGRELLSFLSTHHGVAPSLSLCRTFVTLLLKGPISGETPFPDCRRMENAERYLHLCLSENGMYERFIEASVGIPRFSWLDFLGSLKDHVYTVDGDENRTTAFAFNRWSQSAHVRSSSVDLLLLLLRYELSDCIGIDLEMVEENVVDRTLVKNITQHRRGVREALRRCSSALIFLWARIGHFVLLDPRSVIPEEEKITEESVSTIQKQSRRLLSSLGKLTSLLGFLYCLDAEENAISLAVVLRDAVSSGLEETKLSSNKVIGKNAKSREKYISKMKLRIVLDLDRSLIPDLRPTLAEMLGVGERFNSLFSD